MPPRPFLNHEHCNGSDSLFHMWRRLYLFALSALALTAGAASHPTEWSFTVSGTNQNGQSITATFSYTMSYDDSTKTMTLTGTRSFSSGWGSESGQIQIYNGSEWIVASVSPSPAPIVVTGVENEERGIRFWWGRLGTQHGLRTWWCNPANEEPKPEPTEPKYTIEQTEYITNSAFSPGDLFILDADGNIIGRREVPARFTGSLQVVVPEGGSLKYRAPGEELTLKKVVDGEVYRWEVDPSGLPTISSTTIGEAKDGKLIYETYETYVDPKTGLVVIQGRKAESAVQIDEDKIEAKPAERTDKPAQDDADVDQLSLMELQGISDNTLAISENTASIDQALRDADGQSFLGKLFSFFSGGATEAADKDWDGYASGFIDQAEGIIGDSFSDLEGINRGSFSVPNASSLNWKISIPRFGVLDFDPTQSLPSWFWSVLAWVRELILWAILLWFLRDMLNFLQFVSTGVASSRAESTATAIENAVPGVTQIKGLAFGSVIIGLLLTCYTAMLVILDSNLATLVSGTSFSGGVTVISSIATANFSVPANIAWAWNFIDQLLPLVTIIGVLVAEVLCRISVFVVSVTFLLIVRFVGALK